MHVPRAFSVSRRRSAARGITLTELLVCVAIIGIIAAMTMAVIAQVRGKAQSAQCMSNLRQCGTAIGLYAAEHRGFAPSTTWTLEIQTYLTPMANKAGTTYTNADLQFPISCPAMPYDDSKYGRSTYSLNSDLDTDYTNANTDPATGKVSYGWYMPLRNVEAPARKIMLFDATMASVGSQWANNATRGADKVDFRHVGANANILFVDGHVAALQKADVHEGMWKWNGGGERPAAP